LSVCMSAIVACPTQFRGVTERIERLSARLVCERVRQADRYRCSEIPSGGDLAGLERHVVAERFELSDEAFGEAVGVLAREVVAAEVAV
jgi:hypothetical protein